MVEVASKIFMNLPNEDLPAWRASSKLNKEIADDVYHYGNRILKIYDITEQLPDDLFPRKGTLPLYLDTELQTFLLHHGFTFSVTFYIKKMLVAQITEKGYALPKPPVIGIMSRIIKYYLTNTLNLLTGNSIENTYEYFWRILDGQTADDVTLEASAPSNTSTPLIPVSILKDFTLREWNRVIDAKKALWASRLIEALSNIIIFDSLEPYTENTLANLLKKDYIDDIMEAGFDWVEQLKGVDLYNFNPYQGRKYLVAVYN